MMKIDYKYFLLLIISIFISIGIYKFRVIRNKGNNFTNQSNNKVNNEGIVLSNTYLSSLFDGNQFILEFPRSENVFLVLIRRGDCYDCYKDIPFWNAFTNLMKNTQAFVVIQKDDIRYMKEFIPNHKIELSVLVDESNELFDTALKINNSFTPLCMCNLPLASYIQN